MRWSRGDKHSNSLKLMIKYSRLTGVVGGGERARLSASYKKRMQQSDAAAMSRGGVKRVGSIRAWRDDEGEQ